MGGRGRFDELSLTGMCCGRGGAAAARAPGPVWKEAANARRPGHFVLRRFLPARGRGCGSAMALCGATKVARRRGGGPAGPAALRAKFHSERQSRLMARRGHGGAQNRACMISQPVRRVPGRRAFELTCMVTAVDSRLGPASRPLPKEARCELGNTHLHSLQLTSDAYGSSRSVLIQIRFFSAGFARNLSEL